MQLKTYHGEMYFFNENSTESFNEFSNIYPTAYETNFPLKEKVIKRNIDKVKVHG